LWRFIACAGLIALTFFMFLWRFDPASAPVWFQVSPNLSKVSLFVSLLLTIVSIGKFYWQDINHVFNIGRLEFSLEPAGMLTIRRFPIPYRQPRQYRLDKVRLISVEKRSDDYNDEEDPRSHFDVMLDILYGDRIVLVHKVNLPRGQALCDALQRHFGLPTPSNRAV
jgi:hypothetical protein